MTAAAVVQAELLAGQKLQGVLTSDEVQSILQIRGWEPEYPLFTTVNGAHFCRVVQSFDQFAEILHGHIP